ncbi:hypothetical protein FS749_015737 [Ceratobasidium sp. UAMH 11750]|nr:hypothetical protein FS749_015737 [Ceratobasidium sp. UAMH 11750]
MHTSRTTRTPRPSLGASDDPGSSRDDALFLARNPPVPHRHSNRRRACVWVRVQARASVSQNSQAARGHWVPTRSRGPIPSSSLVKSAKGVQQQWKDGRQDKSAGQSSLQQPAHPAPADRSVPGVRVYGPRRVDFARRDWLTDYV